MGCIGCDSNFNTCNKCGKTVAVSMLFEKDGVEVCPDCLSVGDMDELKKQITEAEMESEIVANIKTINKVLKNYQQAIIENRDDEAMAMLESITPDLFDTVNRMFRGMLFKENWLPGAYCIVTIAEILDGLGEHVEFTPQAIGRLRRAQADFIAKALLLKDRLEKLNEAMSKQREEDDGKFRDSDQTKQEK